MSTYVMSDIHGCYDEFIEILEKIKFSSDDTLYVLGDILDRGKKPITLLFDIMERQNVFVIRGKNLWLWNALIY